MSFQSHQNTTKARLIKHGIAVVIADLSGHGKSEGHIKGQTINKAASEIKGIVAAYKEMQWASSDHYGLLATAFLERLLSPMRLLIIS